MVARCEGMHVEAVADAYVHGVSQVQVGPGEVVRGGDLQVALLARDDGDSKARPPRDFDVVRGAARMASVRVEDRGEAEALRGLRAEKPGAVGRAGHGGAVRGPERVGDGQGGRGAGAVGKGRDHPRDQVVRDQRARHVVDQDEVGRIVAERFQPREHALGPGRAALGHGHVGVPRVARREAHVVGMKDQHDSPDIGGGPEGVERVRRDRAPRQHAPLLRQPPAGPEAAPGGDDHGGCAHAGPPHRALSMVCVRG